MTRIDAYGSESHYVRHLAPIFAALGPVAGDLYVTPDLASRYPTARIDGDGTSDPVLVASHKDLRRIRLSRRRAILVEHGAGQPYPGADPAHPGGADRGDVDLYLCPSERVAEANRQAYPSARAIAIGCPALDGWHLRTRRVSRTDPTVAVSFHWAGVHPMLRSRVAPESAWRHFAPGLGALAGRYRMLGHAHPRAFPILRPAYEAAGVESVEDFDAVLERADVYLVDNSSTGMEFASTGRPVVWLSPPWYAGLDYGGRFWDWTLGGVQCFTPEGLPLAVDEALDDSPDRQEARAAVVRSVYAHTDGLASTRAALAIASLLAERAVI